MNPPTPPTQPSATRKDTFGQWESHAKPGEPDEYPDTRATPNDGANGVILTDGTNGMPSATPRTDAEEQAQTQRFGGFMVKSDFARTLETELAEQRWLKECAIKQTGEVLAELARLRADFASMTMQAATAADRNVGLRLDADRLRSENERLKGKNWLERAEERQGFIARAERAELALANALKEIEVLRWWGNKDCTAMADAALKGIIP